MIRVLFTSGLVGMVKRQEQIERERKEFTDLFFSFTLLLLFFSFFFPFLSLFFFGFLNPSRDGSHSKIHVRGRMCLSLDMKAQLLLLLLLLEDIPLTY